MLFDAFLSARSVGERSPIGDRGKRELRARALSQLQSQTRGAGEDGGEGEGFLIFK
jgi:hypothetical protein